VADRDLGLGLPEVEPADLPRPIDGALVGAPGSEARPHLAQVVVEDRLAALIAKLFDQLAHTGAGEEVIGAQETLDLLLEGVELRWPRPALIARWLLGANRRSDCVSCQPGPPGDLLDRDPVNHVNPPDLRPLLHVDHAFLPARPLRSSRGSASPRTLSPPSAGGQFSTGERGSVFRRRLQ